MKGKSVIALMVVMILLSMISGTINTCCADDNMEKIYLDNAQKLLYVDSEKAIRYLDAALQINPISVDAYYLRGIAYITLNNSYLALDNFSQIPKVNPISADAHFCLGNFHLLITQKYEDAIKCYDKAIELNPQFIEAYTNKAFALYRSVSENLDMQTVMDMALNNNIPKKILKGCGEAIASLDKAININPKFFPAYYNKGIILGFILRDKEAISAFSKALELQYEFYPDKNLLSVNSEKSAFYLASNEPIIFISRAYDFILLNFQTLVLDNGKTAIELATQLKYITSPDDITAFCIYHRGIKYAKASVKDYKRSIEDITKAISLNPNIYRFYDFRALVYLGDSQSSKFLDDKLKSQKVIEDLISQINSSTKAKFSSSRNLYHKTSQELLIIWGQPWGVSDIVDLNGTKNKNNIYRFLKVGGTSVISDCPMVNNNSPLEISFPKNITENYWVINVELRQDYVYSVDIFN